MKNLEDILLSIGGAIVVAGAIYFVDKQLATKQAALAQQQTDSLGANDYTEQQELLAAFSTPSIATGSTSTPTSATSSTSSCSDCGGASNAPSNPTAAQSSIQISLDNLLSASQNNYVNYNSPTIGVDTGTTDAINFNSYATNNAPTVQAENFNLSLNEVPTPSSGVNVQATIPVAYNHTNVTGQ